MKYHAATTVQLSLWIDITRYNIHATNMKMITAEILLAMCMCSTCCNNKHTLESDSQDLTFPPCLTPTVDTTYCEIVVIACLKTSQFMLCGASIHDVKDSPVWCLGRVGGNADTKEINTISTTQCPAHSDIHSSIDIFREANTGEGGGRGRT